MIAITDIKKQCGARRGGVTKVEILYSEDASIRPILNLPLVDVSINNGKRTYKIEAETDSVWFDDEVQYGPGGSYRNNALECIVNALRKEVDTVRQALQNKKVNIQFLTRNGEYYLLMGARVLSKLDTGAKYSEREGYSLGFKGSSIFPIKKVIVPEGADNNELDDFLNDGDDFITDGDNGLTDI